MERRREKRLFVGREDRRERERERKVEHRARINLSIS